MNNNQETEYFTGKIIHRQKEKVYHQKSPYFKQVYYKLIVKTDSFLASEQKLFCYANRLSANIFNHIQQKTYLDKKYRFTAERSKWGWILLDWEEINNKYL